MKGEFFKNFSPSSIKRLTAKLLIVEKEKKCLSYEFLYCTRHFKNRRKSKISLYTSTYVISFLTDKGNLNTFLIDVTTEILS